MQTENGYKNTMTDNSFTMLNKTDISELTLSQQLEKWLSLNGESDSSLIAFVATTDERLPQFAENGEYPEWLIKEAFDVCIFIICYFQERSNIVSSGNSLLFNIAELFEPEDKTIH